MKTRKNLARLLSFLMVLSLLLGISAAPVYAVGRDSVLHNEGIFLHIFVLLTY